MNRVQRVVAHQSESNRVSFLLIQEDCQVRLGSLYSCDRIVQESVSYKMFAKLERRLIVTYFPFKS